MSDKSVAWSLVPFKGSVRTLNNLGPGRAMEVEIRVGAAFVRGELTHEVIEPNDYIQFMAERAWGDGEDGKVTVTWREEEETVRKSWSQPLPPKS